MYQFISIITGLLIAVMISINGSLTNHYGLWLAVFIIHGVGLSLIVLYMIVKKKKPQKANTKLPFYCYLGGTIGIGTTLFNNMAYGKISVSAILALGLLGQCITSLFIDGFGLFEMPKHSFPPLKYASIAVISFGIFVMFIF